MKNSTPSLNQSISKVFLFISFLCLSTLPLSAQKNSSREQQLTLEFLGAERKALVAKNMNMNILEMKRFWPIYESYERDRTAIVDKRITLLEKYLSNPEGTSDLQLELINKQTVSLEKKLAELRESIFEELKKELNTKVAMRFLQIDANISSVINVKLYEQIPLVGYISKEDRLKIEEKNHMTTVGRVQSSDQTSNARN